MLLLNDDYTPMDFVVVVLQTVFAMSREKATQVMLQVHREGMGVCGTYTREVAAAKVDQVIEHRAASTSTRFSARWRRLERYRGDGGPRTRGAATRSRRQGR